MKKATGMLKKLKDSYIQMFDKTAVSPVEAAAFLCKNPPMPKHERVKVFIQQSFAFYCNQMPAMSSLIALPRACIRPTIASIVNMLLGA